MFFVVPKTAAQSGFLILLFFLFAACSNETVTPQVTAAATLPATITPLPPTVTSIPTITDTPEPQQPPACTFPLVGTTMEESMPETYTFSEPRVVLADPKSSFVIGEWLPDSQRVLITRTIIENHYAQYQSIELFNPRSVKVQMYAKRNRISYSKARWVESLNSVIYSESIWVSRELDAQGNYISDTLRRLLWLSNGDPERIQNIEDIQYKIISPHEWIISSLAVKPDGSQIVYIRDNGKPDYRLFIRKVIQGALDMEQLVPFDLPQQHNSDFATEYDISWRPGTEQIFLYNSNGYPGDIHAYLFNISQGDVCEIDFGAMGGTKYWPILAQWSPNGRYLAIIRVSGGLPIDFSELTVVDTVTGNLHTMAFSPQVEGRHYVWDISWAPDNYHLAAIGMVSAHRHCAPNCMESVNRLYLVDFISGKADLVFPSFQLSGGNVGESLAWSPDGTKILAQCYQKAGRLCYIPVHLGGQ